MGSNFRLRIEEGFLDSWGRNQIFFDKSIGDGIHLATLGTLV